MSAAAPLAGRRAVVTGASRGIGRAVAARLVAAGARVALVARGRPALEELAASLGAAAVAAPADLGRADDVARLCGALPGLLGGDADLLVNNAGMFALAPVATADVEEFARTVETNLVAPFRLLRALVPAMLRAGAGHVVTVGSIADRHAFPENGAYAASKFGVRALHEVLRQELRGTGVRASLVSPGPVDTPLWDAIGPDDRPGFTPRAQMLVADDVADAILYALTAPAGLNVDELRVSRA